ncbi:N-acetylmuramoyl-L-alanine amidase family protein [Flavobacterium muglaense]|uniref:N-acetylmuramoyl-L-alanine amidase n=1 Tax=Flavobacterium muglaense TaxID=2764716 RepID=A0A923SGF7_9FLAO|nr:N-acetylmuramoyl-L-alanine amidase [Flavobacterium muglaense]MBC5839183.1 N-acetylmuramoyl-L-alanine amidase [Flavobacterium muglaense]MBC5845651.1 N-acetylmuramoyl-L-alanine amidase [Flavobacterium muglaense]
MVFKYKNLFFSVLLLTFFCNSMFSQSNQKFTVILDAGHGGKDYGANYHGFVEKKVTLAITLKVGKILEKYQDIKIIYTRDSDEFIELKERAGIANRNNANLFISIHCNANRNTSASGSETYVMGMSRSNMNFEVAKSENSVIFQEDNYKETYKGFDPKNPETLIGLKLIQENNLTNSISLATKIQDNFVNYDIKSRGVKQEPLWVLDASVMPGVLVETGFISNREEGARLDSESGQLESATAIAQAILEYKKEYFGDSADAAKIERPKKYVPTEQPKQVDTVVQKTKIETASKPVTNASGIIFKVQIAASSRKLELHSKNFKGLSSISSEYDNRVYKYMYGETSDYNQAKSLLDQAKSKGYGSAFLIAYKNGKKISIQEAIN